LRPKMECFGLRAEGQSAPRYAPGPFPIRSFGPWLSAGRRCGPECFPSGCR
jgi:hypothetical protein